MLLRAENEKERRKNEANLVSSISLSRSSRVMMSIQLNMEQRHNANLRALAARENRENPLKTLVEIGRMVLKFFP